MKVCYFLQTHTNPEQIYRLVRTIKRSSPNSLVVVNHNFASCNLDAAELEKCSEVKLLSGKGGRGNFATMQRLLDTINWLLSNEIEFDWLVNLTGQDYPIQPLAQIESFLSKTTYDGFLEYAKVFSPESRWTLSEGYTRYYYKYCFLFNSLPESLKFWLRPIKIINRLQPFFRFNVSYGINLGIKASVPFADNFTCYGGSFFCTLSRKCLQYLQEFYCSKPEIVDYYKSVSQSDESFIQTVLVNSKSFKLCNDSKRYYDFSRSRNGHPRILTTADYQSFVNSGKHFARKFDPNVDSKVFDLLDERILQLSSISD